MSKPLLQISAVILLVGGAILGICWGQTEANGGSWEGQVGNGTGNVNVPVSFMLYGRELATGYDYFNSEPDPYVIFYKNSGLHGTWVKLLETQAVIDTRKPNWNEVFTDPGAKLNAGEEWRFDLYDFDPIGEDDYMGSVTMFVDEFLKFNATFLPKKIHPSLNPTSGYLILFKSQRKT